VLNYKDSRDNSSLVMPGLENADKTPKLDERITLVISSDLEIAILRLARVDKAEK